ncbi:MAG TPA: hypothetical protein VFQ61_03070 [Polyangiaceae bacterium]|nr:hypothetical protein [Polyangiaceae bacterium]
MNEHVTRRGRPSMLGAVGLLALSVTLAIGCQAASEPAPASQGGSGPGPSGNGGNATPLGGGISGGGLGAGGMTAMLPTGMGGTALPNAGTTGDDSCAATTTMAKQIPLELYFITDSSKSMLEQTPTGATKWQALQQAMQGFFNDPNSAGMSVGLKFFPDEQPNVPAACASDAECGAFGPCDQRKACVSKGTRTKDVTALCSADTDCGANEVCVPVQRCMDGANCQKQYCLSGGTGAPACEADCKPFDGYCRGRDVCTATTYGTPAVAPMELPAGAAALNQALMARTPDGFTPTGPALKGAVQYAQERQRTNPDRKVAIVLVTDGMPGGFIPNMPPEECKPVVIADVAKIVEAGATGMPPVPMFVIGVFGPCDLIDKNIMPQANLDALALAGGTQKSVVISTSAENIAQQLQDALKTIRTTAISCQYALPTQDQAFDVNKVNVNFTSQATGKKVIKYVGTKAACDATEGGWYYDVDPMMALPKQILACDQSCSQFQGAADGRVDILFGCPTVKIF